MKKGWHDSHNPRPTMRNEAWSGQLLTAAEQMKVSWIVLWLVSDSALDWGPHWAMLPTLSSTSVCWANPDIAIARPHQTKRGRTLHCGDGGVTSGENELSRYWLLVMINHHPTSQHTVLAELYFTLVSRTWAFAPSVSSISLIWV